MVRICLIIIVTMFVCSSYGQSIYQRTTMKDQIAALEKKGFVFNYDVSTLQSDVVYAPTKSSPQEIITFLQTSTKYSFEKVDDKSFIIRSRRSGSSMNTRSITTQLIDENLGVSLPYVEVRSDAFGLVGVSDSLGMLSFRIATLPGDSLSMSAIGYELTKMAPNDLAASSILKLKPSNQTLVEFVVTDRNTTKQGFISHMIRMDRIPAIGGSAEKDPLAMAQLMPGLSGLSESVSNISIRSSTADHNLIQWNDIPIYHTGHYMGLMSSINPHVVDQIDVYADGFNSRFGNRVAGVIDMKSQNHHKPKVDGHLHANLLSTNLYLMIPIIRNKLSIQLAGRTSYAENFKTITYNRFFDQSFQIGRVREIRNYVDRLGKDDEIFPSTNVRFHDMNFNILWTPSTKDEVSISFVKARDLVQNELTFSWSENREMDSILLESYGWNARWKHALNSKIHWSTLVTNSGFNNVFSAYNNVDDQVNTDRSIKKTTVNETHFQSFITWTNEKSLLDVGLDYRMIDNYVMRFLKPINMYEPNIDKTKQGNLAAMFMHYNYKPIPTFEIEFGTRLSRYSLNKKMYVEPRISASQKINSWLTSKVAIGQYTQVLSQVEDYNSLQVEDLHWRLADGVDRNDLIPFVQNTQFSFSLTAKIKRLEATLTGYKKNVESITALGLEFDYGAHPYDIAKAYGQGVEASVKLDSKLGYTMVAYSFSDMMLDFDWNRIYPAPYNHRHNINVSHSWVWKGFDVTLVGRWKTGRPYSKYTSFEVIDEASGPKPDFKYDNGVYNHTLPNYLRFDVNLAYKIKYAKSNTYSRFGISMINIFNRTNIVHRVNFVDYSYWPEIRPNTFDRIGLGFTPNVFFEIGF